MKLKYFIVLTLLPVFFAGSCRDQKPTPAENTQMDEVMAIHDEVMPKMATIADLAGKLKEKLDSTSSGNAEYENAMKELQAAHQAMMQWMQGFGERFDSGEILEGDPLTDQKKQWLDEEEEKVRELRDQINTSIENARKVLEE
jgi:hypothetical protein